MFFSVYEYTCLILNILVYVYCQISAVGHCMKLFVELAQKTNLKWYQAADILQY